MKVEQRLQELGLTLPEPQRLPGGNYPFEPVLIRGDRAMVAGHGPLNPDGSVAGPFGKVGGELSLEQGQAAARLVALAMIADLKRALGDLDRVETWLRVFGMVNSAPGFNQQPAVMNGFSNLIVDLFGEAGKHTRSAVGMAELPFDIPVEIEAEVAIRP
jgi:enamine deaminase RidA (YjgF/YER057c/UK114 family)